MRYVYPTEQVIHLWAHQGQDSARNGSNVHFNGPELYSYSTTIAAIIDGIVYISENNMSVTTAKHIRAAAYATRHMEQFYTTAFSWSGSNPRITHDAMLQPAARSAVSALEYALANSKTRQKTKMNALQAYIQERERITTHAAKYGVTVIMPEMVMGEGAINDWRAARDAAEAVKEAARIKAQKKQQKEDEAQFKAWLTTGAGRCPESFSMRYNGLMPSKGYTDFITIKELTLAEQVSTGDGVKSRGYKVITSQGAECPLDHAIKALEFYQSRRVIICRVCNELTTTNDKSYIQNLTCAHCGAANIPTFEPYHTNGHKIPLGIFTLDSIDEDGTVKAECHTFTAAEIQRFITQWREVLGL